LKYARWKVTMNTKLGFRVVKIAVNSLTKWSTRGFSRSLHCTDLFLSQIMKEDFIVCYQYATHYKLAEDSISYRLLASPSLSCYLCRIGSFLLFPASDFNLTHGCQESTKFKRVFSDVEDRDGILAPVLACHHPRLTFCSFTFILTSIMIYT
jgi:hypothetical protein